MLEHALDNAGPADARDDRQPTRDIVLGLNRRTSCSSAIGMGSPFGLRIASRVGCARLRAAARWQPPSSISQAGRTQYRVGAAGDRWPI